LSAKDAVNLLKACPSFIAASQEKKVRTKTNGNEVHSHSSGAPTSTNFGQNRSAR
jgi:hypothetical protein